MATTTTTTAAEKDVNLNPGATGADINGAHAGHGHTGHRFNYGPNANLHAGDDGRMPAWGGEFQPGLFRSVEARKFANPAPLGLSAFALTTFVLSLINMYARDVTQPHIAVALAFGYGGLVQLLAGMWEMAVGNTFGATALSSYGGFWISFALLYVPSLGLVEAYGNDTAALQSALGFFLTGWFIFTFILLLCTLRSTLFFFLLFFTLDMAFLFLAMHQFAAANGYSHAVALQKTGGVFGILAAFLAWLNAFAGIADSSNSFFLVPVFHFPWSEKGREARAAKAEAATV